jgi:hypothetical protein
MSIISQNNSNEVALLDCMMKRNLENNKLYFSPALDSLEEALKQMGITEKVLKEEGGSKRLNTSDIPLDLNYEELEAQIRCLFAYYDKLDEIRAA